METDRLRHPPHPHAFTLAVASGKGGTGKTLVATSLAAGAISRGLQVTLADCDVEAPNAHLFLRPEAIDVRSVEVPIAAVDRSSCTGCGACREICAFGAIRLLGGAAVIFEELCHGCGLCGDVCPFDAIEERHVRVGEVRSSDVVDREGLSLVSGHLDVGQVKSPDVIKAVRASAEKTGAQAIIIDAPPGVACATVAAIRGADALLLVTEPTAFGAHDLELSVRLGSELGLPMGVVLNRVGSGNADIEGLCARWRIPVVARIPFDRRIAMTHARGELPTDLIGRELLGVLTAMSWLAGRHAASVM